MNTIHEYGYDRYEWEDLIDRWIFNEDDRKLLKRRLLDDIDLKELADEMHMTDRQLKRRYYKARKILFDKL